MQNIRRTKEYKESAEYAKGFTQRLDVDAEYERLINAGIAYGANCTALDEIARAVCYGIAPGGFAFSVMCGQLFEAVGRADGSNAVKLAALAKWAFNTIPGAALGGERRVLGWIENVNA